jgi:hypothetical protein
MTSSLKVMLKLIQTLRLMSSFSNFTQELRARQLIKSKRSSLPRRFKTPPIAPSNVILRA